jgi:hypothetical protein
MDSHNLSNVDFFEDNQASYDVYSLEVQDVLLLPFLYQMQFKQDLYIHQYVLLGGFKGEQ